MQTYVADTMLPQIGSHAHKSGIDDDATFELDLEDANRIVFTYPSSGIGGTTYINDRILIDCGSGDTLPRHTRALSPYVAQILRTGIVGQIEVPILDPERSFWEKATILHDLAHRPESKIPVRYSRHYYDVATMIKGTIGSAAELRPDILSDVVDFKKIFFSRPAAQYDLARSGALRLRYDPLHAMELELDYAAMRTEMIFRDAPSLQEIGETLGAFEDRFNQGHTAGVGIPTGGAR